MELVAVKDNYRLVDYKDNIIALEFWNGSDYTPVRHYANPFTALREFEKLVYNADMTKHMYAIDVDLIVGNC
jgi:hypothetical protein